MTVNYTTLLGLAEPVTGTQSGTWGDDVNKGITDYLDVAIAGTQTISGTQTAVTLSITNGSSAASNIAQVASGATGSAQFQIINCTGGPTGLLTITAPASSKTYVVINATSTSQSVKLVAPGPTTGVTVAFGEKAFVAWNGSDFVKVASSITDGVSTISFGTTGLTPSTATDGAVTVAGTLTVANGGTGATSLTANNVILGNGTSAVQVVAPGTTGNVLTSDGTTWTSAAASATGVTSLSVATANGFAGTSSGGSTPILTMTTSITGLLQGNGTAISAVTIGSGLSFSAGTLSTTSTGSTSIGLVRAIAINCILP